ncbi:MAG: YIP1 family protein [Candidatus Aenigmarchaeota archaeon]|nr:YIP1 family protein [Candidatus Aenigmarchaeota archaeon]
MAALSMMQKIRMLFSPPPRAFFKAVKNEKTIRPAFTLYVVALAIGTVLMTAVQFVAGNPFAALYPGMPPTTTASILWGGVFVFILGIVGIFIAAGLVHLFAPHLGGKTGVWRTFNALAYASIPFYLVFWIGLFHIALVTLILVVAGIWEIILTIVGMSELHDTSKVNAFLTLLIPCIIVAVVAMAIAAFFVIAIITASGGLPVANPAFAFS